MTNGTTGNGVLLTTGRGLASRVSRAKAERKPTAPRGAGTTARRLAWGVAGCGVSLMALSLSHCAESIGTLTGAAGWQSWALAAGIDAGMVASEACVIGGRRAGKCVTWAAGYVTGAAILSAILNSYASVSHAPPGLGAWIAGAIGAAIPAGVYALGRVCGAMWE
jgi:hypothetical protein